MDQHDLTSLQLWFKNYSANFRKGDDYTLQNIDLKINHTSRVCRHCQNITHTLDISPRQKLLAEAAGLFHDIGRFVQFQKYRTFNDRLSENHGELGSKIMEQEQCLSHLPVNEQTVILETARYHSQKNLPENKSPDTLLCLRIVRDADKLDILDVLSTYYSSGNVGSNPALDLDLPDTPEISAIVIHDILNNRCVNLGNVQTIHDFRLMQTSWVFDMNFKYSLGYMHRMNHVNKILAIIPHTAETARAASHIRNFLEQQN